MPVNPANSVSLDNGNYNVSWTFNSSTDTLHFMVEVRTTGWVGFGVATQAPTNMMGYDVGVGGVFSGSGYITVKSMDLLVYTVCPSLTGSNVVLIN